MAKKKSIEESFDELDQILADLQGEELTLEESFKKYEAGMKLVRECSASIDQVEKKLIILGTVDD